MRTSGSIRLVLALASAALALPSTALGARQSIEELAELSLEELSDLEVTSVSRRLERLADAAASIFVITADDLRRSGARSLPEALRLAPNLEVAQVSATTWAISARGFNNALGNKLLVLIDGRTVYTPLFSGVFWDAQVVPVATIDRIEVISGPGATLWGANAVNGVINIVTRPAEETQGGRVELAGGNLERRGNLLYGGSLGGGGRYRVYADASALDPTVAASGQTLVDGWEHAQVGFRLDRQLAGGELTVSGDGYRGESEPQPFGEVRIGGANLLARWSRELASGGDVSLQAYYDHTERDVQLQFDQRIDQLDVEFQHAFAWRRHAFVWGAGVRQARDHTRSGLLVAFIPADRDLTWANLFAQDQLDLTDTLRLTVGLRLDYNVYTGVEHLPSLRLAWRPHAAHQVWATASRAVRAPARIDRDFFFPGNPPFLIRGGRRFESEVANVFEIGARGSAGKAFDYALTAFHHDYDRLRSGEPVAGGFEIRNGLGGEVYGLEAWARWQLTPRWRLAAGGLLLRQDLRRDPGSADPAGPPALGNDPREQWSLRTNVDLTPTLDAELRLRRVGQLPDPVIEAYTAVDASLGWQARPDLALRLALANLTDEAHAEFQPGALQPQSEIRRSFVLSAAWSW